MSTKVTLAHGGESPEGDTRWHFYQDYVDPNHVYLEMHSDQLPWKNMSFPSPSMIKSFNQGFLNIAIPKEIFQQMVEGWKKDHEQT